MLTGSLPHATFAARAAIALPGAAARPLVIGRVAPGPTDPGDDTD